MFTMLRKIVNILVPVFFLLLIAAESFACEGGVMAASTHRDPVQLTSEHSCHEDQCDPLVPRCPLCPFWSSLNPYLPREVGNYLPPLVCSPITTSSSTLLDQGVVRGIFHPPTFVL